MAELFWALLYVRAFINDAVYKARTKEDRAPSDYDTPYNILAGVILVLGIFLTVAGSAGIQALKNPWPGVMIAAGVLCIIIAVTMFVIVILIAFTDVQENTAQAILRRDEFREFVFTKKGASYVLNDEHNLTKISDEPDPEVRARYQAKYNWPNRYVDGGRRWYLRPNESILQKRWSWVKSKEEGGGVEVRTNEIARDLKVGQRYPFGLAIADDQFVDANGTPIFIRLTLFTQNTNPYKMWFDNTYWFPLFIGAISSVARDFVNANDYNELGRDPQRSVRDELWQWLSGWRPARDQDGKLRKEPSGKMIWIQDPQKNVVAVLKAKYGADMDEISVDQFIQSEEYRKQQALKYKAQREAEANVERAKGFANVFNEMAMARLGIVDPNVLREKLSNAEFVAQNEKAIGWIQDTSGWQQAIATGVFKWVKLEGLQPGSIGLEAALALNKTLGGDLGALSDGPRPIQGSGQQSQGQPGVAPSPGSGGGRPRSPSVLSKEDWDKQTKG